MDQSARTPAEKENTARHLRFKTVFKKGGEMYI